MARVGFSWRFVAIFKADFTDGAWHQEATCVFGIVPRDINTGKLGACPVSRDGVV